MIKPQNEGPSYLIDDALVKIEREQGMNRRTFVKGGVALATMLAMGGAMGTYAWFTGREVKENKTSIAENLEIEVVEPNFPESGIVENVVPGAVISKDPAVINKSDVLNGYLFTEIRVPIAEVLVEGSEVAERLPLFSFEPNAGWKLLQEFEDGDEKVYRYGWTEVVEHGGQTGSVFDTVTFVNLTGSAQGLDVGEQLVKVIGYGIQDAEAFGGDVAKAWNAYKLQNGITDGVGNKVSAALIAGVAGNKLQFVSGTPSVGDVLDTGEVIEVVEDVEHLPAGDRSPLVSPENIGSVTVVEDVVATKPENTVNWFKDMDSVIEIDISGLDMSEVTDKTGMFDGCQTLCSVKSVYCDDISECLPAGFLQSVSGDSLGLAWASVYGSDINAQGTVFVMGRGEPPSELDGLFKVGPTYRGFESSFFDANSTQSGDWHYYQSGGSSPITIVKFIDRIKPQSTCRWFSRFGNLTCVENFELLDLSRCVDARYMFSECSKFTEFNLDLFHTGNLEYMTGMLGSLSGRDYDFANWDLSSVKSLTGVFPTDTTVLDLGATSLNALEGMEYTSLAFHSGLKEVILPVGFEFCEYALKTQPVYMQTMYANCRFLPSESKWIRDGDSSKSYTPLEVCQEMQRLAATDAIGDKESNVRWTRVGI